MDTVKTLTIKYYIFVPSAVNPLKEGMVDCAIHSPFHEPLYTEGELQARQHSQPTPSESPSNKFPNATRCYVASSHCRKIPVTNPTNRLSSRCISSIPLPHSPTISNPICQRRRATKTLLSVSNPFRKHHTPKPNRHNTSSSPRTNQAIKCGANVEMTSHARPLYLSVLSW